MTRAFPIAQGEWKSEYEEADHPHHRSLWFAHGAVNGVDFWATEGGEGRIEHVAFETPGAQEHLRARNRWVGPSGTVCTDVRSFSFGSSGAVRWIDYRVELHASEGPVTFGDTKEGTMALRVRPELRLTGKMAQGQVRNGAGVTGTEVWGKRAPWIHYQAVVDGAGLGVAILDHPDNLRHPTWWHARPYGLVAANPFGISAFEQKGEPVGEHVLAAGQKLVFRYRILVHEGALDPVALEGMFRDFALN